MSNVFVVSKLILLTLLTLLIEKISLVLSQHLHLSPMELKQQDQRHLNHREPKREGVSETKEKASDVVDVECCCCLKTHFADLVNIDN